MSHSQQFLPVMPLERVTQHSVTPRHSVTWEEIPERAFDSARLERKATASDLGKSLSWFCRALKGVDKLGWSDLGVITDKTFWQEMVDMICLVHDLPPRGLTAQDEEFRRIGKAYCELQAMVARAQR